MPGSGKPTSGPLDVDVFCHMHTFLSTLYVDGVQHLSIRNQFVHSLQPDCWRAILGRHPEIITLEYTGVASTSLIDALYGQQHDPASAKSDSPPTPCGFGCNLHGVTSQPMLLPSLQVVKMNHISCNSNGEGSCDTYDGLLDLLHSRTGTALSNIQLLCDCGAIQDMWLLR